METPLSYFSVNRIFFTVLDYQMSYLEFVGTIFYLWSVWLIAQKKMLTWPIGIIAVILFGILFYQIQLYSDTIEQFYYLGASIYGWLFWKKDQKSTESAEIDVRISSARAIVIWATITIAATVIVTIFMKNIHHTFPKLFPVPASYPFVDALTTMMSFTAMFLMAQKRIESWIYWIIVDVIGIGLYFVKNVKFLSLLYVILLVLAIKGFWVWLNSLKAKS
ncbi:nicotinamide riboside transporter PnuC [Desulfococcaceae bacterium HSG9]|nr:nicotinamide riboside transporter PnuC [Desulfococcaceae bacterium HSG9]